MNEKLLKEAEAAMAVALAEAMRVTIIAHNTPSLLLTADSDAERKRLFLAMADAFHTAAPKCALAARLMRLAAEEIR